MAEKKFRIGFVTLGCDKNTVDSEYFAGLLKENGCDVFYASSDINMDAVIINTCGFIDSAKAESLKKITEWLEYRDKSKKNFKIIVIGCLSQRYAEKLQNEMPKIDLLLGVGNWEKSVDKILQIAENKETKSYNICSLIETPCFKSDNKILRYSFEKLPYSFLRISDGCNHQCAFCAIPAIKGKYQSFPKEQILFEAKNLIKEGTKELNIIGQDTTAYGCETEDGCDFADLLNEISEIQGDFKIRILYAYPSGISDHLIQTIAQNPKIIKYIDIPLQHLDRNILKSMKRPFNTERIYETIDKLRAEIKDIVIRSTFIVGLPGEDDKAFKNLLEGVKKLKFERVGAFEYSKEDGTSAAVLQNQVPKKIIQKRRDILMREQAKITYEFQKKLVGSIQEVLIEQATNQKGIYYGRGYMDAPEVDGCIFINSKNSLPIREYIKVKIINADIYDLIGEAVVLK